MRRGLQFLLFRVVTVGLLFCLSVWTIDDSARPFSLWSLGNRSSDPAQISVNRSRPNFQQTQLPYVTASDQALNLPPDFPHRTLNHYPSRDIPSRRIPEVVRISELQSPDWASRLIPLASANTLAHVNFQARRFGCLEVAANQFELFNPEVILVKMRTHEWVGALRVEPMRESEAVKILATRSEVEFAELDTFQQRQFVPSDPMFTNQWHHIAIGSPRAWDLRVGNPKVKIAIVDTPFQMDHPDLAGNTLNGWDAVENLPISTSAGIVHSTMCAGLAAATVNNSLGIAGIDNSQILPININGAISEMYNAIVWAADHDVRVVNISWTGANSDTLEAAAAYLRGVSDGIVVMPGVNGAGYLAYTNQPHIYCVSMTDAADNLQSKYGPHIDFAAPGWQVYSTSTFGGYAYGTGTSYSTPLVAGVAASLFGLNPSIKAADVINILKSTAADLGPPGRDMFFGWGRVNFGVSACASAAKIDYHLTADKKLALTFSAFPDFKYRLFHVSDLTCPAWTELTNFSAGNFLESHVDIPSRSKSDFFRLQVIPPNLQDY